MLSSQIIDALTRILLLPPTNLIVFMLVGMLIGRRHPRTGRALTWLPMAALVVFSSSAGSMLLAAPLERLTRALVQTRVAGAQAIVVLGAGSVYAAPEYDGLDVPDEVALTRLRYGARLQRSTGLPLLVTGGNASPDGRQQAKAYGMARALREDFRTPVKWVEAASENTEQNARFSSRILRAAGVTRVLLVTHAMHMARSRAAFERAGLQVIEAPTAFSTRDQRTLVSWLPSASGLYRTYYASHEWIGLAWYRLHDLRYGAPVVPALAPQTIKAVLIKRCSSAASSKISASMASSTTNSSADSACGVAGSTAPNGEATGAN